MIEQQMVTAEQAPEELALINQVASGTWLVPSLYALVKLGVPDQLANGPMEVSHLAAEVGAQPEPLARTLRAVIDLGFFTEEPTDHFGLNGIARQLVSTSSSSLRSFVTVGVERILPLYGELLHTLRTGQPAAEKLHGMSYFAHLEKDPDGSREFLRSLSVSVAPTFDQVRAAGLLTGVRTLVELGGGDGTFLEHALRADPTLRAKLLERPTVVTVAQERLTAAGLADRCEFVAGSFFESAPSGGDLYVICRCVHNWGDPEALTLLRTVRAAMSDSARLLLLEKVASPGTPRYADLAMMLLGGRERTEEQHRVLLSRSGFALRSVRSTGPNAPLMALKMLVADPV